LLTLVFYYKYLKDLLENIIIKGYKKYKTNATH